MSSDDINKLSKLFGSKLGPAMEIYNKDLGENGRLTKALKKIGFHFYTPLIRFLPIAIIFNNVKKSSNDINVTVEKNKTVVKIPSTKPGLHYIQYKKALTPERRFFFFEIVKLGMIFSFSFGSKNLIYLNR